MSTDSDNYVKILFRFYNDVLEQESIETMWAIIVDKAKGLYKLDTIPFYAPSVASGDIVFAEYDLQEKMLTYRKIVEYSGSSTVQVIVMDKTKDIKSIRDMFKELGCTSERLNDRYFAMEIPSTIDYKIIKAKLNKLRSEETIDYAEACLAEGHRQ